MIEFMAAVYNEDKQIIGLIEHVVDYVDRLIFVDDGSTDYTAFLIGVYSYMKNTFYERIDHTGLPETVKAIALGHVNPEAWVLMLDADERFDQGVLDSIKEFVESEQAKDITHVWFALHEYIDEQLTKTFQKCRLFRASAANFSTSVHEDDTFAGQGAFFGWTVIHTKSREKQIQRETEYIETYAKLLQEGKITEERVQDLKSMHYFVR